MTDLKAQFVTLEGSEGAGKTTAMHVITECLDAWQVPYITSREPGGEYNAEQIRELLLHSEHLDAKTELLLMFAARNEHLVKVIRPALAAGKWVVSDRFVDASYAYQGYGRGIEWSNIEFLEQMIVAETQPDLTILMDVDTQVGLERAANRSVKDRIEKEAMPFFENIKKGYAKRLQAEPHRIKSIDANANLTAVKNDIVAVMQAFKNGLNQ
ncbi:dTMP kinase [Marinicella sp. S1101]|uniref:dTMP kinase n=1 Tax=Marinicella marina TaxID=2996016 RepID=UPI002260E504|nr:dTMP kinase [Marinicella marina]MCX7555027.1 dTMP kinase [Marinicella marina]MDJ1141309.1 dTMP kinase [Marinicella marina]